MSQSQSRTSDANSKLANGRRRREPPFRLDLTVNPFGPSLNVQEALAAFDGLHLPAGWRSDQLREMIARRHNIPTSWIVLTGGMNASLDLVYRWRQARRSIVTFPPSEHDLRPRANAYGLEIIDIMRPPGFALDPDAETLAHLPIGSVAVVESPGSTSGSLASTRDLVRIARSCEVLVIDERLTGYSARDHLPLMREFDNIILLRTFETWAGLAGLPIAYVIAPPRIAACLSGLTSDEEVAAGPVVAAFATLNDERHLETSLGRVRAEKARLYRTLRKLNIVSVPHPSWANFLLARVERGNPALIVDGLLERGIRVHRPIHPAMRDQYIRISATFSEHTDFLKHALIDIALEV